MRRLLRELAVVLQHSIREGRRFAFFAAGLPAAVDNLLNDDVLTFLRRADRHDLGAVDLTAVQESIISVIALMFLFGQVAVRLR